MKNIINKLITILDILSVVVIIYFLGLIITKGVEKVENKQQEKYIAKQIEIKINEIKQKIEPDIKQLENEYCNFEVAVAIAVNNYLIENVEYDYTLSKRTAYDCLFEGSSVCAGYTKAYNLILESYGIETKYLICSSDIDISRNHCISEIIINNQKYYTDVTWNDTKFEKNKNRYLLISYEQMSQDHYYIQI